MVCLRLSFSCFLFSCLFIVKHCNGNETLRYVGQPIPANCSAMYACDPGYIVLGTKECLRWRVQKINCNRRLMRIETPSYVEVVTTRPRGRYRGPVVTTTTTTTSTPYLRTTTEGVSPVHIIDVPCITGYLPDRNGRCRQMW